MRLERGAVRVHYIQLLRQGRVKRSFSPSPLDFKQLIMPSVAELVPQTNFQENVGNDWVCRSIICAWSSELTTELRSLTGSVVRMTVPWWIAIILNCSFPGWNAW